MKHLPKFIPEFLESLHGNRIIKYCQRLPSFCAKFHRYKVSVYNDTLTLTVKFSFENLRIDVCAFRARMQQFPKFIFCSTVAF